MKICPKCGTKNFDDARYCMKCTGKISGVKPESMVEPSPLETQAKTEFNGWKPRGYTPQPWEGRVYSRLGLVCVLLYFIFLMTIPIYIVLFIFSILATVLGKIAIKNGDKMIGKFSFFTGLLLLIITLIFFILEFV